MMQDYSRDKIVWGKDREIWSIGFRFSLESNGSKEALDLEVRPMVIHIWWLMFYPAASLTLESHPATNPLNDLESMLHKEI
ncbi:hypothetical protein ACTXT7_016047 [Hymenolepis weldensis]